MGIQHDTYLDTPGGRFFHSGASLRLREKDGGFTLTMKTSIEATRVRTEEEDLLTEDEAAHVRSGALQLVDCDVAVAAIAYAGGSDLSPVLLASNQRQTWDISAPTGSIKMCFDWVHYSDPAGLGEGRTEAEYELELELQQGPRSLVTEAARYLSYRFGLPPQTRSKYQRGVSLLGVFSNDVAGTHGERHCASTSVNTSE
jgi:inorganic triphosphatase YgiF